MALSPILLGLLVGLGIGIVVVPILIFIIKKIVETKTRLSIKRMIKKGKFLMPIDPKDVDMTIWRDKFNLVDSPEQMALYREKMADKIYKRGEFKPQVEI